MIHSSADTNRTPPAPPREPGDGQPAAPHGCGQDGDLDIPELARLAYFHGQLLSAADLRTEQSYFREKLKLHNRCLHGHGVVCGFEVEAVEVCDDARPGPHVRVRPGVALDQSGNEVLLRRALTLHLPSLLDAQDRAALREGRALLSLYACFCEQPSCRAQSVLPEACGSSAVPHHARVRDAVRFEARVHPRGGDVEREAADEACDGCCAGGCREGGCVLLARIGPVTEGSELAPGHVDAGVRRMLARYVPTRIAAISWQHGATYSPALAKEILGTENASGGLELHFTRPVSTATLSSGVLDVWVVEGGRGRSASIWHLEGEYVGLPASGYVRSVRYRHTGGESLQSGDRVLVVLRGAFVLDRCCRPLAGVHVGGKVPLLPVYAERRREPQGQAPECVHPPGFPGPWTTGSELGGTTFESWFFVG